VNDLPLVAYFSMEIALEPEIPTYAGGLGVLAGDTLRSAADLGVPMVAVSLVHRAGYFRQEIVDGEQREAPDHWPLEKHLERLPQRVEIELEGRPVEVRGWRYLVRGVRGAAVPVYLLDTDTPANAEQDRRLTDQLYGGDDARRLAQEAVLGLGGVRFLRALGHDAIGRFHLNEGHAALIVLAILEEAGIEPTREALERVRARCVFTTHTPVAAGHDRFSGSLVSWILGDRRSRALRSRAPRSRRFPQPRTTSSIRPTSGIVASCWCRRRRTWRSAASISKRSTSSPRRSHSTIISGGSSRSSSRKS